MIHIISLVANEVEAFNCALIGDSCCMTAVFTNAVFCSSVQQKCFSVDGTILQCTLSPQLDTILQCTYTFHPTTSTFHFQQQDIPQSVLCLSTSYLIQQIFHHHSSLLFSFVPALSTVLSLCESNCKVSNQHSLQYCLLCQ